MLAIPKQSSAKPRCCYQFSSTQINLPRDLADRAVRWGEYNVKETDLFVESDEEPPSKRGRELNSHITVLYGINEKDPRRVLSLFRNVKPFVIDLGRVSLFKMNKDFDVIKVEAFSPRLQELNALVRRNVSTEQLYPDYKPHVTIAFVKKDTCDHLDGHVAFTNQRFVAREVQFSNVAGENAVIYLG